MVTHLSGNGKKYDLRSGCAQQFLNKKDGHHQAVANEIHERTSGFSAGGHSLSRTGGRQNARKTPAAEHTARKQVACDTDAEKR